jgi:hypothetical protein
MMRLQVAHSRDLGMRKSITPQFGQGVGEVIYGQNKRRNRFGILQNMKQRDRAMCCVTRISDTVAEYLRDNGIESDYHPIP